ncbi:MAG: hypothetical protein M3P32_03370 [Chloroflexota bacterium]|nr:hypothetical protein [Chloroflexota bacterium]
MSRGRPRHQSSRRRMYSPRQRDMRERRIHQRGDEVQAPVETATTDPDDGPELEASSWGIRLSARAGAA